MRSAPDHSRGQVASPAELRTKLAAHRRLIDQARHEFLDTELALSLHEKLGRVLDRWDSFTETERGLIAEAVRYLVDTDDEEHDLLSPIGFVDDEEQINDVLRRVAPDLLTR